MSFATNSRFEYNFTRQNQFEDLRQKNNELQKQNHQLRSQLIDLLQVHEELQKQFQQFQKIHQEGQNAEEMQQKIELLTDEVQTLRRQIQEVQYEKSKTSNRRDSNPPYDQNKQNDQLLQVLEEMTSSFQNVYDKYESDIDYVKSDMMNLKNQWSGNFKRLEQQYKQKIHTFEDVIIQLKRKDQLVAIIEEKLKISQNALRNLADGVGSQKPVQQVKNTGISSNNTINKKQSKTELIPSQQREKFQEQIEQKNRMIKTYQQLIGKLKNKLQQKY